MTLLSVSSPSVRTTTARAAPFSSPGAGAKVCRSESYSAVPPFAKLASMAWMRRGRETASFSGRSDTQCGALEKSITRAASPSGRLSRKRRAPALACLSGSPAIDPEVSMTKVIETGRFTLSNPSSTRRVTATGGLGRTFLGCVGSIPCAGVERRAQRDDGIDGTEAEPRQGRALPLGPEQEGAEGLRGLRAARP